MGGSLTHFMVLRKKISKNCWSCHIFSVCVFVRTVAANLRKKSLGTNVWVGFREFSKDEAMERSRIWKLGQRLGLRMFLVVEVNARSWGGGGWDVKDLTKQESHVGEVLGSKVAQNLKLGSSQTWIAWKNTTEATLDLWVILIFWMGQNQKEFNRAPGWLSR